MFTKYSEIFSHMVYPLLDWYDKNQRQMAWRSDPTPYHVWISEIMLQQTRVEAVRGYYDRFISTLPDISSLAAASTETLYKLWEGLGYYSRVRNLKKAAEIVMSEFGGFLPSEPHQLQKLPGIGAYTAGAIASIAFQKPAAAVDGNVVRVFARLCDIRENFNTDKGKKMLAQAIETVMPPDKRGDFTQALMELGALICIPATPRCDVCPLAAICRAKAAGSAADLPVLAAKKEKKKEKYTVAVIRTNTGEYLLQQRGEKGLLAGMWQFWNQPGTLSGAQLTTQLQQQGLSAAEVRKIGCFAHIFTHVRWDMTAYYVKLYQQQIPSDFTVVSEQQLAMEYALPRAFSVILDGYRSGEDETKKK